MTCLWPVCVPQQRRCLETYLLISFGARSREGTCIPALHQQPNLLVNGGGYKRIPSVPGSGFLRSRTLGSAGQREGVAL